MKKLQNDKILVKYYEKTDTGRPYIMVQDLTDVYNEQAMSTRKIRGIEKAWQFITQLFEKYELKEDINFSDIGKILDDKFNLKTHYWCMID